MIRPLFNCFLKCSTLPAICTEYTHTTALGPHVWNVPVRFSMTIKVFFYLLPNHCAGNSLPKACRSCEHPCRQQEVSDNKQQQMKHALINSDQFWFKQVKNVSLSEYEP